MSSFKEVLIGLGSSLLSGVFAWHPRRFGLNSPEPPKIGVEAHTYNPSNEEVEVGGSEVQVCLGCAVSSRPVLASGNCQFSVFLWFLYNQNTKPSKIKTQIRKKIPHTQKQKDLRWKYSLDKVTSGQESIKLSELPKFHAVEHSGEQESPVSLSLYPSTQGPSCRRAEKRTDSHHVGQEQSRLLVPGEGRMLPGPPSRLLVTSEKVTTPAR